MFIADSGQPGDWCLKLLRKVFESTPHNWPSHTLETFPPLINEFYVQNTVPVEDKQQLQRNVEAELNRWKCELYHNLIVFYLKYFLIVIFVSGIVLCLGLQVSHVLFRRI